MFIHLLVGGHLDYFQVLTIISKASKKRYKQSFMKICAFISFGEPPRSEISMSYGKYIFSLVRYFQTVHQNGCAIFHPPAAEDPSNCSKSLTSLGIVSVLNFNILWFNLHFPND